MTAHAVIKNTFFEDFFVQKSLTIISEKGFLNSDKSIICQNIERLKNYKNTKIPKIIDDMVFNSDDESKALSKNDFANNILNDVFSNVSFDGFRPTFERLKIILSKK